MESDPRESPQNDTPPPNGHRKLTLGHRRCSWWIPACGLQHPLSHSYLFVYLYVT